MRPSVECTQMIISSVDTDEKLIALTFDDGPSTHTSSILTTLAEHNALATFFVRGGAVTSETKEIVKKAHAAGHEIKNHTHHHWHLGDCDETVVREEIGRTHHHLGAITDELPRFIRPPYGHGPETVDAIAAQLDY